MRPGQPCPISITGWPLDYVPQLPSAASAQNAITPTFLDYSSLHTLTAQPSNAPRSATLAMNSRYRWSTEAGVSALAPPAPPAPPGAALRGARPKPLPASARCAARCGCLGLAGAVSRLTRRAAGTCGGAASWWYGQLWLEYSTEG